MPTYVYQCFECGLTFEEIHPVTEAGEPSQCPNCGVLANRSFTAPSVIVRGQDSSASLTDALETHGQAAAALGMPHANTTPQGRARMAKAYERRQERKRQAAREARRANAISHGKRPWTPVASIPAHVYHKNQGRYQGQEGIEQAKREGFGL